MATITAAMVKELREKTGAGMMDCKTALNENDGDMEGAVDWLRTKGLASAAKKSGRVAAEGLVGIATKGTSGALVEVNSETDFVARNDQFQEMVSTIAQTALDAEDIDALSGLPYGSTGRNVADQIKEMIGTIGENMVLRRCDRVLVSEGVVSSYIHNAVADGLGKIGVIVGLQSSGDAEKAAGVGRQVAMHVAAANPLAVRVDELDPDVVARERAVYAEQARESGKPEAIIEKMVEGRMRKFHEEVVLLSQAFVIDTDKTVEQALADAAGDVGAPVEVTAFAVFRLGEGVEKEESDFAAEVAAAAGTN